MNQKGFASISLVVAVIILAGVVGYLGFVHKYCEEIAPPKMGQQDSRIVQIEGKIYFCQTFFDKIFGGVRAIQLDTRTLQEGNEISIEGTYIKNTTDSELEPDIKDGASYQVIDTKEYGQIRIITGGFRMNCLTKEIYQPSKEELVEIYGKVVSNPSSQFFDGHILSVCLSDQYYIKKK